MSSQLTAATPFGTNAVDFNKYPTYQKYNNFKLSYFSMLFDDITKYTPKDITLGDYNNITKLIMGYNIQKTIIRFNRLVNKINYLTKEINKQFEKNAKYFKSGFQIIEKGNLSLCNKFKSISENNQPHCFNNYITIPTFLITKQKIDTNYNNSLNSIYINYQIYYNILDCVEILKDIMTTVIKILITKDGTIPLNPNFNKISSILNDSFNRLLKSGSSQRGGSRKTNKNIINKTKLKTKNQSKLKTLP